MNTQMLSAYLGTNNNRLYHRLLEKAQVMICNSLLTQARIEMESDPSIPLITREIRGDLEERAKEIAFEVVNETITLFPDFYRRKRGSARTLQRELFSLMRDIARNYGVIQEDPATYNAASLEDLRNPEPGFWVGIAVPTIDHLAETRSRLANPGVLVGRYYSLPSYEQIEPESPYECIDPSQFRKSEERWRKFIEPPPHDPEHDQLELLAQQGHWARRDRTPKYF